MNDTTAGLRLHDVRRRFDRAAGEFEHADFLHRTAAEGIFDRLAPIQIRPRCVIDLGCASGRDSRLLAKRFRGSRIIGLDLSAGMLRQARSARPWLAKIREIQAHACALPFVSGCADLVFANLLLPWIDDVPTFLTEVARVLRKDGLFVFSSLGPDSLGELRAVWRNIDSHEHVNRFDDMHDIGDSLLQQGLRDPVLDVDHLLVEYRDLKSLFRDLTRSGARNSLVRRRRSLTPKSEFAALEDGLRAYFREDTLSLRLELVYGHAFNAGPTEPAGEIRLDAASIGRRRG